MMKEGKDESAGGFGDDDGDDLDNEFEGNADVADMIQDGKVSEDGDIDEDFEFGGAGGIKQEDTGDAQLQQEIIHS